MSRLTSPVIETHLQPATPINSWVHRFAVLTAAATLGLIGLGGLVTSHGVGMSVPDWPNTYGYNMFFFPFSKWVGGIFYEHSHRLFASAVGLLTTVLALWFYGRNARRFLKIAGALLAIAGLVVGAGLSGHRDDGLVLGLTGMVALGSGFVWPRCEPSPKWLRRLGVVAFFGVVLQGVLGGLRVVLFKDQIGIFHATLAQLFFVLICALALFTSRWWQNWGGRAAGSPSHDWLVPAPLLPRLFAISSLLILAQLILGATMRHQHAGLAIPDFPMAYGRLWPALDPASVAGYNQHRMEVVAVNPITAAQIVLQMVHRLFALAILAAVAFCLWRARRELGRVHPLSKAASIWLALILIQALLGAATIWSNKAADVATLHVMTGAVSLALGTLLTIVAYRLATAEASEKQPAVFSQAAISFGTRPAPATGLE